MGYILRPPSGETTTAATVGVSAENVTLGESIAPIASGAETALAAVTVT